MKKRHIIISMISIVFILFSLPLASLAKEEGEKEDPFSVPDHVFSIAKENTFPNSTEDLAIVEPSGLTKELLEPLSIEVENPEFIKMLNETTLKPSPIGIGYRGMIYLGRWALRYDSTDTTVNWEYQQINKNELNNFGGEEEQILTYHQQEEMEIKGALTNQIEDPDQIKQMILLNAKEKTNLPLAYQTVIGKNTTMNHKYNIPTEKHGFLHAYAPAVNEKGQITFGEVYVQLKGTKKSLVIKNVTKQGIGAWIPIQDHVSFQFQLE